MKPSYDGKYFLYIEISGVTMESLNESISLELFDPRGGLVNRKVLSEFGKVTFYIDFRMEGNYSLWVYQKGDYVQNEEFPLIAGT